MTRKTTSAAARSRDAHMGWWITILVALAASAGFGLLRAERIGPTPAMPDALGAVRGTSTGVPRIRVAKPRPSPIERAAHQASGHEAAAAAPGFEAFDRRGFLDWRARLVRGGGERVLREVADWVGSSFARLDFLIDQASDAELIELLTAVTNLERAELDGVRDLRAYSRRLGRMALAHRAGRGVASSAASQAQAPAGVAFAEGVRVDGAPADPRTRFGEVVERIHAVFPASAIPGDNVVAKWIDVASGDVVHFGRYPVEANGESASVWMRPEDGWAPGDYAVELFEETARPDAQGRIEPVARGRFGVGLAGSSPEAAQ